MKIIIGLAFIVLFYIFSAVSIRAFERPKVVFINVRQGDAFAIYLNPENVILIDGGNDLSVDNSIVGKYTYPWCSISKIFLSHFHTDHFKGIPNIAYRCSHTRGTFNDISLLSYDSVRFRQIISKNKYATVPDSSFKNLYRGSIDQNKISENIILTIYTLWPPKNYQDISNENDRSLVLLVDVGNFEILFTGDASGGILEQVLTPEMLSLVDGRLEIYKVPHHGSPTGISRKVLDVLRPVNCVISVGKNSFGHPDTRVIHELESSGCRVRRTDVEGNIEFAL